MVAMIWAELIRLESNNNIQALYIRVRARHNTNLNSLAGW